MELFPAIDLFGQKAVRLLHGDYAKMTVYNDNPVAVAMDFKAQGLHIPDCIISANDHMAYGYLLSAREDGYEAPEDFRITGFDNMDMGQDFIPSITSINR